MKTKLLQTFLAGLAFLGAQNIGEAAATAHVGDPAAPLNIAQWVKGSPVDLAKAKGKQVVVVEFWATWCGPCLQSIPHLTELQKHFKSKDVVFVGVSDEETATVTKFVKTMGDKMDYVVAVDNKEKTGDGYMKAYAINGIPHAFVIGKEGTILWQGHPMAGLDKVLERVVSGRFDTALAKKIAQVNQLMEQFYELAGPGKDDAKVDEIGRKVVELSNGLDDLFETKFAPASAKKSARVGYLLREYQTTIAKGGDDAAAEEIGRQIEALEPGRYKLKEIKASVLMGKMMREYFALVYSGANESKAKSLGETVLEKGAGQAQALNNFAWAILTDEKIKSRDLDLAMKAAKAAYDACEGKTAHIVDTYARALFDTGKVQEAIQQEEKAVQLAEGVRKEEFKQVLKGFREKAAKKK